MALIVRMVSSGTVLYCYDTFHLYRCLRGRFRISICIQSSTHHPHSHPSRPHPLSPLLPSSLSPSHPLTHHAYAPVPTPTATKLPTANHLKSPCWCQIAAATQWPKLTQLTTAISVPPKLERWEAGTRVCVSWVAERS